MGKVFWSPKSLKNLLGENPQAAAGRAHRQTQPPTRRRTSSFPILILVHLTRSRIPRKAISTALARCTEENTTPLFTAVFHPNSSEHPRAVLVTGSSVGLGGIWVDVPELSNIPHKSLDFPPFPTQATLVPKHPNPLPVSLRGCSVDDRPGA